MQRLFGFVLIVLIFLIAFETSVQFSYDIEAQHLYKLDHGCKDVDIRFDIANFDKLVNCQHVHGYLRISYLDFDAERVKPFDIREITGYLLVDHVKNLKSLSQLFPNLTIISGEKLHNEEFSLVITSNDDLEYLNLSALIYIKNGSARIKNNPKLKFTRKIDFDYGKDETNHEIFVSAW